MSDTDIIGGIIEYVLLTVHHKCMYVRTNIVVQTMEVFPYNVRRMYLRHPSVDETFVRIRSILIKQRKCKEPGSSQGPKPPLYGIRSTAAEVHVIQ